VLSTTLLDGAALDVLSPLEDALASAEVDVSGREVVQALVIAAMIVVLDEVGDSPLEITGEVVVLEQDSAFQREVPALDLSLVMGW
jgi:hypothetical protein